MLADSDDTTAKIFCSGEVRGYQSKTRFLVKQQKTDDGPIFPAMAPAVDVQQHSDTTEMSLIDALGDDKRYAHAVDDDAGFLRKVPVEVFDDIDDVICLGSSLCD